MAGKFVIKKSGDQYHFVLKAGNGEIIATSERYKSKGVSQDRHQVRQGRRPEVSNR